jgi:hypothetical protein
LNNGVRTAAALIVTITIQKMLREMIWHAANRGSPWVWYFLKLAKPADLEYGSVSLI